MRYRAPKQLHASLYMQGKKSGNSTRAGEGPKPGKSKSGKKAGRGKK